MPGALAPQRMERLLGSPYERLLHGAEVAAAAQQGGAILRSSEETISGTSAIRVAIRELLLGHTDNWQCRKRSR